MQHQEGAKAVGVDRVRGVGVLGALLELKVGACIPTNASVHIPQGCITLLLASNVPFHDDGARLGTRSAEDEVRHLNGALVAGLPNLEDRLRVLLVLECAVAAGQDERPDLADDLDVLGDLDCVGDDVGAVVEVNDLVFLHVVEDLLDSIRIVCHAVALGAVCLDAHEGARGYLLVLGLGPCENLSGVGVEEDLGLRDAVLRSLDSLPSGASLILIGAALDEEVDLSGIDDDVASRVVDYSLRCARQVDVVENESTVGLGRGRVVRSPDTNFGVLEGAVNNEDGANRLAGWPAVGHVDANLTVVDSDVLEGPSPVPVHEDGRLAAVEGHVARRELLAAKERTILAAVESEIRHEATGAVVHEDSQLSVLLAAICPHVEDDVLEACRLRHLPVDTSSLGERHGSQVNVKVADLAEEVVLVHPEVVAFVVVGVSVDDGHAFELGQSLDRRAVDGVADQLGVVELNDGLADGVCAWREVHQCRSGGARGATLATSLTIGDGLVDCFRVVGRAVTLGTVVSNVAEDLVARFAECRYPLPLDGAEPPA